MTELELYFLRSILRSLREYYCYARPLSLGGTVLADNIDWLDCFIDKEEHKNDKLTKVVSQRAEHDVRPDQAGKE